MQVISLKDYAKNKNISYEAVRKQVARFAEDLGEHLIKDGRQQFLDEEAVAFLDERRKKNPVVIYEVAKDEEIDRLKEEKERILLELAGVQKQLIQEQQKNALLIEENKKIFLLEADNESARKEVSEISKRLKAAEDIADINAQEAEEAKKKAADLQLQIEEKEKESETLQRELEELKQRGFWARLFNRK